MPTQSHTAEWPRQDALDAYFKFEYQADRRHEFMDGKIVAIAYTSEKHGTIVSNLNRLLGNCLLEKDCSVYASDRMLFVPGCNGSFYPDVMVVCGAHQFHQAHKNMKATLNPAVIIEVLSNSTEHMDKTHKTRYYKQIPSLRQMLFIAQDEMHVRILEKEGDKWVDTEFYDLQDILRIGDCDLPLPEVYRRVTFSDHLPDGH